MAVAVKIHWDNTDRLHLRWKTSDALADPTRSSLWDFYKKAALLTPIDRWSLPGAPCGGSPRLPAMHRTMEPLAAHEHGLRLYDALDDPTPSDDLVRCAMIFHKAFIEVDLAAEGLRGTHDEGYDALKAVMGPLTAHTIKPLDMVSFWLGGIGILGVTLDRRDEVAAVLQFLHEVMAGADIGDDRVREFAGFFGLLVGRMTASLSQKSVEEAVRWMAGVQARVETDDEIVLPLREASFALSVLAGDATRAAETARRVIEWAGRHDDQVTVDAWKERAASIKS